MTIYILAGDIGGTNTRLILSDFSGNEQRVVAEKKYQSANYSGLVQVIDEFISEYAPTIDIDAACFAVAGPVESGVSSITNLPWIISEEELIKVLKTPRVKLINDFVAAANGVSALHDEEIEIIQHGENDVSECLNKDAVIIGAGTGLGVAHIAWQKDHYQVYSSEAGHVGFAPENAEQIELLYWLQKKYQHVSLEMLLSGNGLHTIYQYLREVKALPESVLIREEMKKTDPAQVITEYAILEKDSLCKKTLDIFVDIYGAAASNAALFYYPVGTLYIAGGIAPKIKKLIMNERFIQAFLNKGVMSLNMKKITVKLIVQDNVGLYGALINARALRESSSYI